MDELVPVMNKLQDIFATVGANGVPLNLPQIVVVGSQSSGKSSVLESIVGKDFLPRGNGICTRRPLHLQLINQKNVSDYAIFHHKPNIKFADFMAVKSEIINETNAEIGDGNGISPKPIKLKIFSEKLINLTLVDLPGLTKVAADDQPTDIEKKVRKLILSYAENEESIILAVIPSNADIATSDALQIAKSIDPQSNRTIGVLTKVDLMDKGQSVANILDGKVFPLKYGYIAVKNRSQMEINNNLPIEQCLRNEEIFFSTCRFYKHNPEKTGIPRLRSSLNRILVSRIKTSLPKIKFKVKRMIEGIKKELELTGGDSAKDVKTQAATVLSILSKFCLAFNNAIDGKEKTTITTKDLFGGARISTIFHGTFAGEIQKIDPFGNLSNEEIGNAIKNATGTKPSLFVPEMSFEILSKSQILKLKEPSLNCVDMVYNELIDVSRRCNARELQRYSKFQDRIVDCVGDVLRLNKKPAVEMVEHLIDIELSYINTNHPDFIGGSSAVPSALKTVKEKTRSVINGESKKCSKIEKWSLNKTADLTPRDTQLKTQEINRLQIEIEIIKALMLSYYRIVRKNVMDAVPKAVMHFLVNKTKEELQSKLVSALYKSDLFEDLLEENQEVSRERLCNKEMLKVLGNALVVIDGIREYKVAG